MKSDQIFEFNLSQINKIRPRQVDQINVKNIIKKGDYNKLNEVINDLSQENFEENEERKGLKTYQLLTQYMIYSINHLKKKQEIVNDLYNKQRVYNETADAIIHKQNMKIKELELTNDNLNSNCVSMEHLMKHLNLEDVVLKLGVPTEKFQKSEEKDNFSRKDLENENYNVDEIDYSSDENM